MHPLVVGTGTGSPMSGLGMGVGAPYTTFPFDKSPRLRLMVHNQTSMRRNLSSVFYI